MRVPRSTLCAKLATANAWWKAMHAALECGDGHAAAEHAERGQRAYGAAMKMMWRS